jgi:hypothetical protein
MKKSLFTGTLSLLLLIGGCSTTPAAGPAGPQGPPGDQGAAGQDANRDRDRDRDRDKEHDRDAARPGEPPSCPAGQHPYTDHDGRTTCVRD